MVFVGLFAVLSVSCIVTNNGRYRNGRLFVCIIVGVYLLCIMGLRHINYGGLDTQVYARDFTRIVESNYSFADIFENFYKDYGFYLFAKLVSLFTSDVNCWIFICAIPYIFAVVYIIYKYSDNVFLSFVLFISLGFYLYDFQLMRHVFSMAFIIFALEKLQKGNNAKFFVLVIIATMFHATAAIALFAYFIKNARLGIKQLVWIFIGAIAIAVFILQRSLLIKIFSLIPFLSSSRLMSFAENSGTGTVSNFMIQMLFVLLVWFYMEMNRGDLNFAYDKVKVQNINKKDICFHPNGMISIRKNHRYITSPIDYNFLFNLAVVGALFYLGQLVVGESYRIAQFFSIYTIILVPNILHMIKNKKIRIVVCVVIAVFALRHFFGGLFVEDSVYYPYQFFWESKQSLY